MDVSKEDAVVPRGEKESLHKKCLIIAAAWLVLILAIYASATLLMVDQLADSKAKSAIRHQARIDPTMAEIGRTAAETTAFDTEAEPLGIKVDTGIYVDRVFEFSTKDSKWSLDFYIWFNWTNNGVEPGENFQIIEGTILNPDVA